MSYTKAIEAFAANIRVCESLVDAKWKPFAWNLNVGLNELAQQLERDMKDLKAKIDRLEKVARRQE